MKPQANMYSQHQQQQQIHMRPPNVGGQQIDASGGYGAPKVMHTAGGQMGSSNLQELGENISLYSAEVQKNPSCIFFGNIPYDVTEQDLRETLQLAGPFLEFRLKTDQKTNQPKGYGFCEYRDPDVAASALRNLNRAEINGRNIKVDFASDNKNGTNLKEEDVKFRDRGELVNLKGEYLSDHESTVEEILNSLSPEQEQLLLFGIRDSYEALQKENPRLCDQMIENLAMDEQLLENLTQMLERVQSLQGGPQYMSQGGIYHFTSQGATGANPQHNPVTGMMYGNYGFYQGNQ